MITYLVSLTMVGDFKARGPALVRKLLGWVCVLGMLALPLSFFLATGTSGLQCVLLSSTFLHTHKSTSGSEICNFFFDRQNLYLGVLP